MGCELNVDIVVFFQYFGYSLEKCIKFRYEVFKFSGVDWLLNCMFSIIEFLFQKYLERDKELVVVVCDLNVNEFVGDQLCIVFVFIFKFYSFLVN